MERCFDFPSGDRLVCTEKAAIITFSGARAVLSSGALGGGLRYDLTAAFNYSDCGRAGICSPMNGRSMAEHQAAAAIKLGLDPGHVTGLDTAANLDNMAVSVKRYGRMWAAAAVSGGADVNAMCAGDPSSLTESGGEPCPLAPGTINIFLLAGPAMAPGAMTELAIVAAEAKAALLRDWMQGSCASSALATGTGTDGIVVICPHGGGALINGGKHFKIAELAALAVREAASEALYRQTGFCPESQHSVLSRLRRFGITSETIRAQCLSETPASAGRFRRTLEHLDKDGFMVAAVSLYVHLIDQLSSGLLSPGEAEDWFGHLAGEILRHYNSSAPYDTSLPPAGRINALICGMICENLREQARLYPEP